LLLLFEHQPTSSCAWVNENRNPAARTSRRRLRGWDEELEREKQASHGERHGTTTDCRIAVRKVARDTTARSIRACLPWTP
jgi:hypothetical protein